MPPGKIKEFVADMGMDRPGMPPAAKGFSAMSQRRNFIDRILINKTADNLGITQYLHGMNFASTGGTARRIYMAHNFPYKLTKSAERREETIPLTIRCHAALKRLPESP
jgi:hypothetical protein